MMKLRPSTILAAFLILLFLIPLRLDACAGHGGDGGEGGVWSAQYGGPEEGATVVATTKEEWTLLWQTAGTEPPVDFDPAKHIAVGVFLGTRTTGGYTVEIVSAAEEDGVFVVRYLENAPPQDAMVTMAITNPYVIKLFPKAVLDVRVERAGS